MVYFFTQICHLSFETFCTNFLHDFLSSWPHFSLFLDVLNSPPFFFIKPIRSHCMLFSSHCDPYWKFVNVTQFGEMWKCHSIPDPSIEPHISIHVECSISHNLHCLNKIDSVCALSVGWIFKITMFAWWTLILKFAPPPNSDGNFF